MSETLPQKDSAQATGESSTNLPPEKSLAERAATALGKIQVLGDLISWESIRRGMKHEDEMARRDAEANHRAIYGDDPNQKGSEDEMGHIVLGDYRIDQHLPQPAQSQQTSESPGLLKKALAIGLAVAAGTSPLGIGAYFLADKLQQPQPVVQPEAKTEVIEKPIGFTVGDPIVE